VIEILGVADVGVIWEERNEEICERKSAFLVVNTMKRGITVTSGRD